MNHNNLSEVDLQNYCQLLVDRTLISQSQASQALEEFNSTSTPDYPRCPICVHRLIICHGCSSVTCDNYFCRGARLVQSLLSCRSCFSTLQGKRFCNELCESRAHFSGGAICPDCVKPTDGHLVCVGGHVWVCGACATQKKTLDNAGRCPRCQDCYCFSGCNIPVKYIGVCEDCQRSTLCNDCMELEDDEDDWHLPDMVAYLKSPVLLTVCERCDVSICADCFEERRFRVCCGRVCCRYCSGNGECGTCGEAPMYQLPGARPQVARE